MHMKMSASDSLSMFLIIATILLLCFSSIIDATCLTSEKQALVEFKKHLKDPSGRLSSWNDHHVDCCKWEGVVCSNKSNNVIQLHLQNPGGILVSNPFSVRYLIQYHVDFKSALSGKISPSLLNLTQLHYLDLSLNDFKGIPIPSFLGSLKNLRFLNLSLAGFQGLVPHELGNLSSLRTLSIGMDNRLSFVYSFSHRLQVDNLQWLAGLSNLEHLDMNFVNLSTASNWLEVINMIPSLVEVHLSACELIQVSQLINVNFSSLTILDLSLNRFQSFLPKWIFGLNALVSVDLSDNNFETPWPRGPWNLTSLSHLDLSWNRLNGSLPRELFNLNNLISLNLGGNRFEDSSFPSGNWNWSSLKSLDLSYNNFNWFLPNLLLNLSGLISLDLGFNNLQGSIPSTIANISNLQYLDLSSNHLNSSLPNALFTLGNLIQLDLRYNQFNGSIPSTVGNFTKLKYLGLSGNNLNLSTNKWLYNCTSLESLLLNNQLQGAILEDIVQFGKLENLRMLDLANNALSGSIPLNLGRLSSLEHLYLDRNKLTGTLPASFGQLSKLKELYISYNLMEGIVTETMLDNLTNLNYFYASGNSLTLKASASWIPRTQFIVLGLGSWNLGHKFPTWLQYQKHIEDLDLSLTGISGTIPSWFWNLSTPTLSLNLSHNQLHGEIPNVSGIGTVDLNSNQFIGTVLSLDLSNNLFSEGFSHFLCDVKNGDRELQYLYLGDNFLSGEIPDCWMNWPNMYAINLNNNNFTGSIPTSMINLENLWELHLSNNSLSGQIPLIL